MSLKCAILGLLDYAPMTGYNLGKLFSKSVNNIWTASLSQIYRELTSLEKQGYVSSTIEEQEDRPDKKIYTLTVKGRQAFSEWLTEYPESYVSPKRDAFMLKILFGSDLGKNGVRQYFERFIEDRKTAIGELEGSTGDFSKIAKVLGAGFASKMSQNALYIKFTLKRALAVNKLLIQWAQDCIKELEEYEQEG